MSNPTTELDHELARVVEAIKRTNFIVAEPDADGHESVQVDGVALYIQINSKRETEVRCLVALIAAAQGSLRRVAMDDVGMPYLDDVVCESGLQSHSSSIFEMVESFNQQRPPGGKQSLVVLAVR